MQMNGWSTAELARRSGRSRGGFDAIVRGDRKYVTARLAGEIRALYDELWGTPAVGRSVPHTIAHAIRQGTAPPLAWDEGSLDNPDALPARWATRRPGVSERRSVELVEDLDFLAAQLGFVRVPGVLGWDVRARRAVAARLGMGLGSFDRAVYRGRAYGSQLGQRSVA